MELGLYTFAETPPDRSSGLGAVSKARLADLLEEIELADRIGLDVFGLGEHHRPDFVVSAPAVVLGAAAARTKNIRLTSAVSVLSSDDPIRVFQQFATLDLLSNGRAEIMAGRGSFIESFPLFGYDLHDYDTLFAEKLALLLALRGGEKVNWPGGRHTAPLAGLGVYPRPVQAVLPVWIAVGGTPQSAIRAGTLGLPMALAIIGGDPARFVPFVDLYRDAGRRAGHDPKILRVGINSHGFLAEDEKQAADIAFPPYFDAFSRIGRERGWSPPSRAQFDAERSPSGSMFVGSAQQVIDKILREYELFRHDRFLMQLSVGSLPHAKLMRAIEIFGGEVAPVVRREIAAMARSSV